ncbi:hypothetical protein CEXT_445831 [Caerostris extrusa]|uniref:Uncharacterized protein n=1 Tax=Caerostris extrusa TaxID=172846 RepID=A0AAV4USU4_CAEEX|nr:hypothetical protein CEXT_445831 [Caerostris extrusa]
MYRRESSVSFGAAPLGRSMDGVCSRNARSRDRRILPRYGARGDLLPIVCARRELSLESRKGYGHGLEESRRPHYHCAG